MGLLDTLHILRDYNIWPQNEADYAHAIKSVSQGNSFNISASNSSQDLQDLQFKNAEGEGNIPSFNQAGDPIRQGKSIERKNSNLES